jgi:hypothetical protein
VPKHATNVHATAPVAENLRAQLVEIGIGPYESRQAALFGLAGEMPAPVLAKLLGITDTNAADWPRLAARDSSRLHRRPRTLTPHSPQPEDDPSANRGRRG